VTRDGDQVYLSWKQLSGIICSIVLTGIAAAGVPAKFLWDQNQRLTVNEQILVAHGKTIESVVLRLAAIEGRDSALVRVEQHLVDIDRQLSEIKATQRSKEQQLNDIDRKVGEITAFQRSQVK